MQIQQLTEQLNWIDWGILLILAGYMVMGIQRGFIMGILDLLGMAVSLGAGVLFYRQLSSAVLGTMQIPSAVATLGSFLLLVIVAQVIYSAIVNLIFRASRPFALLLGPFALADRALGVLPGAVKGLIFTTLLLLPFALFPLIPQLSADVERSQLASRLVVTAVDATPGLESVMGRELNDGLAFLTPPQTEEGMKLNFGMLGKLQPDPTAEDKMLELLNAERVKAGLQPLQMDEGLRKVARAHSLEMFQMGYFAHNSPVSGSPFDRMRQADIHFGVAGENLAYAPNVQIAHEGLMNSPGHRANILRPEFRKVGIGVIKSEFRGSMFSQEFTN